jgi:hypothetical protein
VSCTLLEIGVTADALAVAGRPRLHQVLNWYNLIAASAAGGSPFVINNGLWPLVPILVGNATVVVSEHGYMYPPKAPRSPSMMLLTALQPPDLS